MLPARTRSRLLLGIALAATLVLLSAPGRASACSMMTGGDAACGPVCSCCEATAPAEAASVERALPPSSTAPGCFASRLGVCGCRSEAPKAPEPRASRKTIERPEPGRVVGVLAVRLDLSARPVGPRRPLPIEPTGRFALYLRHSRLLI